MRPNILTLLPYFIQLSMTELNENTSHLYNFKVLIKKQHNFIYKGEYDGCSFKENSNESAIIFGADCKKFPTNYEVYIETLKLKKTGISVINKNDFHNLKQLTMLVLEYNSNLKYIEPGSFKPLSHLSHLKMTLNYNLTSLHEKVFEGLNSLTHLSLTKNGFTKISDITQALIPQQVPNLINLDLSENVFGVILKDDFIYMNNSKLEELELNICELKIVNENSLLVLKNLKVVGFGGNHFNQSNLKIVIQQFVKYKIPLESINLQDSGYRTKPPFQLLKMISYTTTSKLSLAKNEFEKISKDHFPPMAKIKSLDLSYNLIIFIENDSFAGFTSLEELYLSGNKISRIFPAILLPHLKILDLRYISNKPTAVSYLLIDNKGFKNMTNLQELRLSYNLIELTGTDTFEGLINLKYLEIKNATLFSIRENSFLKTPNLTYLNLENNPLQAIILNSRIFAGLFNVKTLLLGGCNIVNLTSEPSPFYYLSSLTYLGLNNNIIYTLTPHVFAPLTSLKFLDLSNNKLAPWRTRLFSNNSLQYVDLSQNKFTLLTRAMVEDFKTIENLNVDDNPFICDCNLLPSDVFEEILSNSNYTSILDANCSNSEFRQKSIRDFVLHVMNNSKYCNPDDTNKTLVVALSSTFVIILLIIFVIMFFYRYYIRYWLFLIKMAVQRHSKWWKKGPKQQFTNFKYDAFVSYSCVDCYFVNKLVTELENNEPYLKLCVYERDFKIGSIISEEVMDSILKSKRTVLVISHGFAKSQWCRWETKLAEHHQVFFQNDDSMSLDDTLVMVKLSDIPKKLLTPTLKYLMKTRIYLEWNKKNEQEFWKKLRNTLSAPKYFSKNQ